MTNPLFKQLRAAKRMFPAGDLFKSQQIVQQSKANLMLFKLVELSLQRHLTGDWGDVGKDAFETNTRNIKDGGKLVSIYQLPPIITGIVRSWGDIVIVTEASRKETLIMFMSEFDDADKKQTFGNRLVN